MWIRRGIIWEKLNLIRRRKIIPQKELKNFYFEVFKSSYDSTIKFEPGNRSINNCLEWITSGRPFAFILFFSKKEYMDCNHFFPSCKKFLGKASMINLNKQVIIRNKFLSVFFFMKHQYFWLNSI